MTHSIHTLILIVSFVFISSTANAQKSDFIKVMVEAKVGNNLSSKRFAHRDFFYFERNSSLSLGVRIVKNTFGGIGIKYGSLRLKSFLSQPISIDIIYKVNTIGPSIFFEQQFESQRKSKNKLKGYCRVAGAFLNYRDYEIINNSDPFFELQGIYDVPTKLPESFKRQFLIYSIAGVYYKFNDRNSLSIQVGVRCPSKFDDSYLRAGVYDMLFTKGFATQIFEVGYRRNLYVKRT